MKPLSPTEVLASTYEGLAPVPMDLARRVRAGQPAPAVKPTTVALEVHEAMIGELRNLRAEVARLEGLRKRCEVWLEWWVSDISSESHPEASSDLLRDLRAGRAAT